MVYHVMKDGSVLTDISGKVIKMSDVPTLYQTIHNIKKKPKEKQEVKSYEKD